MIVLTKIELKLLPEVISHLRKLGNAETAPKYRGEGLCCEMEERFPDMPSLFVIVDCTGYSFFSGNDVYPVKHPFFIDNPGHSFHVTNNHWEGEYGDRRKKLCLYIANELEDI